MKMKEKEKKKPYSPSSKADAPTVEDGVISLSNAQRKERQIMMGIKIIMVQNRIIIAKIKIILRKDSHEHAITVAK